MKKARQCFSNSSSSSSLCAIPSHILAAGVFKYLQWKDVGRLDTACTNLDLRSSYLSEVYRSLRVDSVFFNSEKEKKEHSPRGLYWPVVSHEGASVESGAELLTVDDYFANVDQKFYRFTKYEAIIWAIDRSICLNSSDIHLSLYRFNPHTRDSLIKIFTYSKGDRSCLKIKSLWISEAFDVENFLMDHVEALKYVREVNFPLRTFELWDFISSLPSLNTLYLDEKAESLNYGISALSISHLRTKLRFLYLGNTEGGYSYRFFANLGNFQNLESLCVHNLDASKILHGKLDEIFLPVLPNLLPNLKRLIIFRCPTITFIELAFTLARFVNSSTSKLKMQYLHFEETNVLLNEDNELMDAPGYHSVGATREKFLQHHLQGCVVKYSIYFPEESIQLGIR